MPASKRTGAANFSQRESQLKKPRVASAAVENESRTVEDTQDDNAKDAERDKRNVARRAARQLHAYEHPDAAVEERQESGRNHSSTVSSTLLSLFAAGLKREAAVQQAISSSDDHLCTVQAVVNAHCSAERHLSIAPNNPVWGTIPPRTMELLATIARSPTDWDPTPFLRDETICESHPGDPAIENTCVNYLRRILVPDTQAVTTLEKFLVSCPAEAYSTTLQLLLLGADLTTTQNQFHDAMTEFGLEDAVDTFFAHVLQDATARDLFNTFTPGPNTAFSYAGISAAVAPGSRFSDDIKANAPVRILNFVKANPELQESFTTYHISALDTPILSQLDVRTNPDISSKERILRAILGSCALNSAPGGNQPIFDPPPSLIALLDATRSVCPPKSFPLGREEDAELQRQVSEHIDDQVQLLGPLDSCTISPEAVDQVKQNLAQVIRLNQGKVVALEITKDIPREGILAKAGGYWQATTGVGPREDRYMRTLLEAQISTVGDLDVNTIARWIGPHVDFWGTSLRRRMYWVHVLLLSRLLGVTSPLVIVSQSNPVANTLRGGDLHTVWDFVKGHAVFPSTSDLVNLFPDNIDYQHYTGAAFNELIGALNIIPTGPLPQNKAILIVRPDYGRRKYDPVLAPSRCDVDFLICVVREVVIYQTGERLDNAPPADWNNGDQVHAWLTAVKTDAEHVLFNTGVTQALEQAKNAARRAEFTVNYLRSLTTSKRQHEEWRDAIEVNPAEPRKKILPAAVGREARLVQLEDILQAAHRLASMDLPVDPRHIGNIVHPILSDSFPTWFMALADGQDVVRTSNALGRTDAARAAIEANRQLLLQWHTDHPIRVDLCRTLTAIISEAAPAGPFECREIDKAPRIAKCRLCHALVVAANNKGYHFCADSNRYMVTEKEFPDVERILYAHDILDLPELCDLLGPDFLADLHLVAIPVQQVIATPWFHRTLASILNPLDLTAICTVQKTDTQIFVPEDRTDDRELLVTLSVDRLLAKHHRCPEKYVQEDAGARLAWTTKQSKENREWVEKEPRPLMCMAVCHGRRGDAPKPHFFLSTKASKKKREDGYTIKGGRRCNICDPERSQGGSTCMSREWQEVDTLFDMPPHYSRQVWLNVRRGILWLNERGGKQKKL